MTTATISSKGQITIPVNVRNDLQVDAGDRVAATTGSTRCSAVISCIARPP